MQGVIQIFVVCLAVFITGCEASGVALEASRMGHPVTREYLLDSASISGPVKVTKWTAARWEVPLSGVLNLKHPEAVKAGMEDRSEPIELFVYTLEHPVHGVYMIDSGVSVLLDDPTRHPLLSKPVVLAMNLETFEAVVKTSDIVDAMKGIKGVFLTHIHLDHILGLTDLPADTPVFIGPGDARYRHWQNAVTRGSTDRLLNAQGILREWDYSESHILDVFDDGTVFAIHSPGHTPGTTAYLVVSTDGPQLMIGDVTHTRWGWKNGVEPGSYSFDIPQSAESLAWLLSLADDLPGLAVHPGHQHAGNDAEK